MCRDHIHREADPLRSTGADKDPKALPTFSWMTPAILDKKDVRDAPGPLSSIR